MSRYTIDEFTRQTHQKDRQEGVFELEGDRFLEVHLNGLVWMKKGAMVAYLGDVRFEREGILEHGVGRLFKKMFTGESLPLTKGQGRGVLYLADQGKKITILNLRGDTIYINGSDLLAFEPTIQWDIKFMKSLSGILAGGLFNVRLEGTGMIALTTHFDPITLLVQRGQPVFTDPQATVAWSGSLYPELKTDISLKSFFGRASGESLQMRFDGEGFVVIQPFEEGLMQMQSG
ncbi:MAG: AIM24 family protein [Gemmataceae bacterium]